MLFFKVQAVFHFSRDCNGKEKKKAAKEDRSPKFGNIGRPITLPCVELSHKYFHTLVVPDVYLATTLIAMTQTTRFWEKSTGLVKIDFFKNKYKSSR